MIHQTFIDFHWTWTHASLWSAKPIKILERFSCCISNERSWWALLDYIFSDPTKGSSSTKLKREKAGIHYIGVVQWVVLLDLTTHTNLSPIGRGFGLKSLTFGPWNWGQGQRSNCMGTSGTSAWQKNHMRFNGKCMLYSLCQLPPPPNSP